MITLIRLVRAKSLYGLCVLHALDGHLNRNPKPFLKDPSYQAFGQLKYVLFIYK